MEGVFDRDYIVRETYGRVWWYARKYRLRLVVGIVMGMLTAGTLVPLFQVIQPALEKVSASTSASRRSMPYLVGTELQNVK